MGQYYVPMVIDGNNVVTFSAHFYGNGLKLMEHSYIGNDFINAVTTQIWNNPKRVAWIGDYSDEFDGDAYEKKISHSKFMTYFKKAWGKNQSKYEIRPADINYINMDCHVYLINHTEKKYVNIADYIACNKWHERWTDGYGKVHEYDMCMHPLPLLTACGNGRGGGDYRGSDENVGRWAFDLIEISDKKPSDEYAEVMYYFRED